MPSSIVALGIFELAGVTSHCRDGVGALAIRLVGLGGLHYADMQAERVRVELSPDRILIQTDLSDQELTMAVARGIALWWRARQRGLPSGVTVESLAAEIAVPRASLDEAIVVVGVDIDALADEFVCPPSVILERIRSSRGHRKSGTHHRFGVAS
jgi:hypothetical protein